MNVRYAEVFFDPQGHTRVGTKWETMMQGFREATWDAEQVLNVRPPRESSLFNPLEICFADC